MKFVHLADMHFDRPFTILGKNDLGTRKKTRTKRSI